MFRPDPMLAAHQMKTYAIVSPVRTHTRPADCDEVECGAHRGGWRTAIDESTNLGRMQAQYIRLRSGRRFAETREANLTVFVFEAGQICFAQHRISLDRPAHYLVKGGDHRGNPLQVATFKHTRPEHWVEDFALHQRRIADEQEKG